LKRGLHLVAWARAFASSSLNIGVVTLLGGPASLRVIAFTFVLVVRVEGGERLPFRRALSLAVESALLSVPFAPRPFTLVLLGAVTPTSARVGWGVSPKVKSALVAMLYSRVIGIIFAATSACKLRGTSGTTGAPCCSIEVGPTRGHVSTVVLIGTGTNVKQSVVGSIK